MIPWFWPSSAGGCRFLRATRGLPGLDLRLVSWKPRGTVRPPQEDKNMSLTIDAAVLRDACALLSSPARWTCGAWARDSTGEQCSPPAPQARQWCACGALQKCAFALIGDKDASRKVADRISKQLVPCPGGLAFVNDVTILCEQ